VDTQVKDWAVAFIAAASLIGFVVWSISIIVPFIWSL
jgi:hypothetical protein